MFIKVTTECNVEMLINTNSIHSFEKRKFGIKMYLSNGKIYTLKETKEQIETTLCVEGLMNG